MITFLPLTSQILLLRKEIHIRKRFLDKNTVHPLYNLFDIVGKLTPENLGIVINSIGPSPSHVQNVSKLLRHK